MLDLATSREGRVQFLKFAAVGTGGFCVDTAVLYALMGLAGLGFYSGRAVSFVVAATATWSLNRRFTFAGRHVGPRSRQWARFVAVNAVGGAINYGIYAALVASGEPFRAYPVLAVAVGALAGLMFNFTASRRLVFRPAADAG